MPVPRQSAVRARKSLNLSELLAAGFQALPVEPLMLLQLSPNSLQRERRRFVGPSRGRACASQDDLRCRLAFRIHGL